MDCLESRMAPSTCDVVAKSENGSSDPSELVVDVCATLNDILDRICSELQLSNNPSESDSFFVIDKGAFRTRNEDGESIVGDRITCLDSDEDSEEEFLSILEASRRLHQKNASSDDEEEVVLIGSKMNSGLIEREYDNLPNIEQLKIHVDDKVKIVELGKVTQIVDCLVVVQCDSNIALNYDTVLFDQNRNAIGQVFDIFGAVASPLYSIRFNSAKEAQEHSVGEEVYYAPAIEEFTHEIFTDQLKNLKITDSCWDGEGDCPDDQVAFSDDEAERRFLAKTRHKKSKSNKETSDAEPRTKRADPAQFGNELSRGGRSSRAKRGRFGPQFAGTVFHGELTGGENLRSPCPGPSIAWPHSRGSWPSSSGGNWRSMAHVEQFSQMGPFMPRQPFYRPSGRGDVPPFPSAAQHCPPRFAGGMTTFRFGQRPSFGNFRDERQASYHPAFGPPSTSSSLADPHPLPSQTPQENKNEDHPVFVDSRYMANEP